MKARLEIVTAEDPRKEHYARGEVHLRVLLTIEGARGEPFIGVLDGARKAIEMTLERGAVRR